MVGLPMHLFIGVYQLRYGVMDWLYPHWLSVHQPRISDVTEYGPKYMNTTSDIPPAISLG